jgi:hydroxymethylpyrimidine pyrophosphatase-like HAD family hydrolase
VDSQVKKKAKKSYFESLEGISTQITDTLAGDVLAIIKCFQSLKDNVKIVVGSGGSYTTASFYAHLFEKITSSPCLLMTPTELLCTNIKLTGRPCFFFSAEGKNPDILQAFEHAVAEGADITCFVNFRDTPLAKRCDNTGHNTILAETIEKDGFLAVGTIISTVVAGWSAFQNLYNPHGNPLDLSNTFNLNGKVKSKHQSLFLVYSPNLKATAIDFESRAHESGLVHVQIADLRNFSHGRHYGSFLNQQSTLVLVLSDVNTRSLARRTIVVIGSQLETHHVHFKGDIEAAAVKGIIFSTRLLGEVAKAVGRDPNRVNVPKFGRALYYLPYDRSSINAHSSSSTQLNLPSKLLKTKFGAIVFDYDGTLCNSDERLEPLTPTIIAMLENLLRLNIKVGIATGRGKSAGEEIRRAIDAQYWKLITIGYYNGSIITSAEKHLDINEYTIDPALMNVDTFIEKNFQYPKNVEVRPTQITIDFSDFEGGDILTDQICEQLFKNFQDIKIVRSSHSIDIINKTTSKLRVLSQMQFRHECITVGDNGQIGGNDYELLSHRYSVSVNHPGPGAVAKMGLPDEIELAATLRLFECMVLNKGYFCFED